MRKMYDSDNETYPDDVEYIGAYVDGSRTGGNYARAIAKHPNAHVMRISAVGTAVADVIDIEPGCVWPPSAAVDWTIDMRRRGINVGYYCNTSTRNQVLAAYRARGVDPGWWWRADYRSNVAPDSLPLGEVAWQYADPALTGSHWDVSVIADDFPPFEYLKELSDNSTQLPTEEDDMYSDDDRNRDTKLAQDLRDSAYRLEFWAQEGRPFKLYLDTDSPETSPTGGWVVAVAPGIDWHIPNWDYVSLLQYYRLGSPVINVVSDGTGNVFNFIRSMYAKLEAKASNQDVLDALKSLDITKLTKLPAPIIAEEIK